MRTCSGKRNIRNNRRERGKHKHHAIGGEGSFWLKKQAASIGMAESILKAGAQALFTSYMWDTFTNLPNPGQFWPYFPLNRLAVSCLTRNYPRAQLARGMWPLPLALCVRRGSEVSHFCRPRQDSLVWPHVTGTSESVRETADRLDRVRKDTEDQGS